MAEARVFDAADQLAFARLSGDFNPMHMDAAAARRTPAGAPVVHGVQSMLWALERIAALRPLAGLGRIDADFARFLYVGDPAELTILRDTGAELRAELRSGSTRISVYTLKFTPLAAPAAVMPGPAAIHYDATRLDPLPLDWDEVAATSGTIAFASTPDAIAATYPALAAAIGMERIGALLALTRLVGMVSPGLHSTFHRINATLTEPGESVAADLLGFAVAQAEPRYQLVTFEAAARGLSAKVKASRRTPPTAQPGSAELRGRIAPASCAGRRALVIGGSRGIGEVTAKLLALGGAEVLISYVTGATDAQAVADDIRAAGGRAETVRLDMLGDLDTQLAALPADLGSVYYFATGRIAPRAANSFDAALFAGFCRIYVEAFARLCERLVRGRSERLAVFYPSTVYVEEAPAGLGEYAMAKAAGEVCAADLTRTHALLDIHCARLPRMATDQTAGMIAQDMDSPVDCMVPIIGTLESAGERRAA